MKTELIMLAVWSAVMLQSGILPTSYITNMQNKDMQKYLTQQQAQDVFLPFFSREDVAENQTSLLTSTSESEKKSETKEAGQKPEHETDLSETENTKTNPETKEPEKQIGKSELSSEQEEDTSDHSLEASKEEDAVETAKEKTEKQIGKGEIPEKPADTKEDGTEKESEQEEKDSTKEESEKSDETEAEDVTESEETDEEKEVTETEEADSTKKESEEEKDSTKEEPEKSEESKTEDKAESEETDEEKEVTETEEADSTKTESEEEKDSAKEDPEKSEESKTEDKAESGEEKEVTETGEADSTKKESEEEKDSAKEDSEKETVVLNTDPNTLTFLVNKEYALPADYVPELVEPKVNHCQPKGSHKRYMRAEAAKALEKMFAAAKKDGFDLWVKTAYRSYKNQYETYTWMLEFRGVQEAVYYHAVPGTSEHQTGLAVDIVCEKSGYENDLSFEKTSEYQWLRSNCHKYGFTLRYLKGMEHITGYNYEPWHYRYVGVELATYLMEHNLTLEEYYDALPTTDLFQVPEEYRYLIKENTESN